MSDKKKYPYAEAMEVASEIQHFLTPHCDQLLIAGSLRRGKAEVGDIEILYIPRLVDKPDGLFDTKKFDMADGQITCWLADGSITKRPNINGGTSWGEKNKLAIWTPAGIPVDFFATTKENWWVSLVIRTGSKETNLALTTGAQKLGGTLNAYGCGVTTHRHRIFNGTPYPPSSIIPATSERDVFELCGVEYKEPKNR